MPTKIKIQTNRGDFVAELFSDDAIKTVKNFVTLAQSGYYDGLTFHRVIEKFVIQGGDPTGTGSGGPGYTIPCETRGHRQKHKVGAFSMAHAGRDTGGSQFFVVLDEGNTKHLNGKHTVFGQTIEGLDVVQQIQAGDKMLKVEVLEVDPAIEAHELQKLRVIEQSIDKKKPKGPIHVTSGFDVAGENLKLAVKVENTTDNIITSVQVILDVPNGFEFVKGTDNSQSLGNISGGEFQSAIFWLKPLRCVDGDYSGTILYKDAKGSRQTIEIPSKHIVNICPMLTSTESADEVFSRLKSGSLARNCASFEFSGNPSSVLQMAEARLKGLVPVDRTENEFADGTYLGYSCYVGQTKYGEDQFASEIQVSGTLSGGILTLSIYSDDERILSGFFVDVMHDVRNHVEILKERMCPLATCPKCGGNIDLSKVGSDRIYQCEFCGVMGKAAPWMNSG